MKINLSKRSGCDRKSQVGFIQAALLFGIALMTAILGGFALANRTPTSQTDVEEAKVNASVILKQASDLRDGVQRYSADYGSSAVVNTMTFDDTSTTGLFDPAARYASPQIMPNSVFEDADYSTVIATSSSAWSAGHWRFNDTSTLIGVGSSGGVDVIVALPDITTLACNELNKMLYGSSFVTPTSDQNLATWAGSTDGVTTAPVGVNPTATGSELAGADGYTEACVQASDGNVYFKVIQEN